MESAHQIDIIKLTKFLKTEQEAHAFVYELEELAQALFNIKTEFEKKVDELLTHEKKIFLLDFLEQNKVSKNNPLAMKNFVKQIQQVIFSLPVLSITLSITPPDALIQTISDWVTKNSQTKSLLSIHVDQSLIGGIILENGGIYKDYSFKKPLSQKLTQIVSQYYNSL